MPAQAGQPVMVSHSKTQIEVEWPDVADEQGMVGMISGYYLWMDNGFNENFQLVWNGEGMPDVRNFTTNSLELFIIVNI